MKRVCRNCGSVRRGVYRSGYCGKCFTPAAKLTQIAKWDLLHPKTLTGYPRNKIFHDSHTFEILRWGFSNQAKDRLEDLCDRERIWRDGADGMMVERMLRRLSEMCGCAREVHYGAATRIDRHFPPHAKRELCRILLEIEEEIPWRGCSVGRAIKGYNKAHGIE